VPKWNARFKKQAVAGKVTDEGFEQPVLRELMHKHSFDFGPKKRGLRGARVMTGKITDLHYIQHDKNKDVAPHLVIDGNRPPRFDQLQEAIVQQNLTHKCPTVQDMLTSAVPLPGGNGPRKEGRMPVHWYFEANQDTRLVPFPRKEVVV